MYVLIFTNRANNDLKSHKKSGNKALLNKLSILLKEIQLNPYEGIGHPEALKGELSGLWLRRIDKKHRLVYEIFEAYIEVHIIAAKGHYNDK
ncbi:MAG: Txe/YoeB family addiction module toxin [Bacteroidales bacterium]|jgi:toxin YoeB|nr:Txe/YoeB family addiction module toxin [Bacteroidales bacterium]